MRRFGVALLVWIVSSLTIPVVLSTLQFILEGEFLKLFEEIYPWALVSTFPPGAVHFYLNTRTETRIRHSILRWEMILTGILSLMAVTGLIWYLTIDNWLAELFRTILWITNAGSVLIWFCVALLVFRSKINKEESL